MKKTFLISVAKYFHKNATHEELTKTKLTVTCKDWIDAVIEHNKVFKNYYEVESYCIIGDGPVRIQIVKAGNLNMGDIVFISKKLFEIESEMGLIKTLAEEAADRGEKPQTI